MTDPLSSRLTRLSLELVIVLALFLFAAGGFVILLYLVFGERDMSFDKSVFEMLAPYVNADRTKWVVRLTFLADWNFLVPANLLLAVWFLLRNHRWHSLKVPVVALGSVSIMYGLKLLFGRSRPANPVYEAAQGFSFPSGHAMSALTFYGLIIYLVWHYVDNGLLRWVLTIGLSLLIIAIAASRVYLRVHFASDVLAGMAVGVIWLVISLLVMNRIEGRQTHRSPHT